MGLYTNTVTTTWANLRTTLAALTANTSVIISDPNNVIFAPMTSTPATGTCFGDIIYSATPSTVLVDFSDNDFSANTNVTNSTEASEIHAGWFGIFNSSDTISCTRLSGMGKLPVITTSGRYMFSGCSSLASIDTTAFTNVTGASSMFWNCTSLASIDTTAFTNVTGASFMFSGCSSLASIDTTAFTNVTGAGSMFYGCTSLASIDTTAFTNVTNAYFMFHGCTSLASIDASAFTNVTDAESMFNNCTSLTSIDASAFTKVTDAESMFYNCKSLTSIDASAFTKVTNAHFMFHGCTSLASIDASAFTNVTNASFMFNNCTSLTSIDASAFTKVTDAESMFWNCTSLASIYMFNNTFNLSAEPSSNNTFMETVPLSCVFYVTPSSYSTWYSRLYTNYSKWGLSAAKTPTTANLVVYHRVA